MLVLDRQALSSNQSTVDLVNSLLGLMFRLKEGQPFALVFGDDLSTVYGPLESNTEEFIQMRRSIEQKLASPPPAEPLDLVSALAETYNYLNGLVVSSETAIYVITGDTSETDPAAKMDEVGPVLSLVEEAGWPVFNVTTPEADPGLKSVLSDVSRRTSGESFDLSIPNGLEEFTNRMLIRGGKGALQAMGKTILSPDSIFETDLDIVPRYGRTEHDLLPRGRRDVVQAEEPFRTRSVHRRPKVLVDDRVAQRRHLGAHRADSRTLVLGGTG